MENDEKSRMDEIWDAPIQFELNELLEEERAQLAEVEARNEALQKSQVRLVAIRRKMERYSQAKAELLEQMKEIDSLTHAQAARNVAFILHELFQDRSWDDVEPVRVLAAVVGAMSADSRELLKALKAAMAAEDLRI